MSSWIALLRRLAASAAARGVGITFAARVTGAALGFGTHLILARLAGASEYGTYSLAYAVCSTLAVGAALGFPQAVVRFVPEYAEDNRWRSLQGLVRRGEQLGLTTATTIAVLGTVAAWLLGASPFPPPGGLSETVSWTSSAAGVLVGLWILPAFVMMNLYTELCRSVDRFAAAYVLPRFVHPLLLLAGITTLYVLPQTSLTGVKTAGLVGILALPVALVQRWTFWKRIPASSTGKRTFETRYWLSVALPMLLVRGFLTLLEQTDVLLVGWMLDAEAAGLYKAASTLAGPVSFVFAALNAVAAPRFARLHAAGNTDELRRFIRILAHASFWPTLLAGLVVVVGADVFLGLFGPAFTTQTVPLTLLVAGHVVNAGTGAVGYLLNMTGNHRTSARVYGTAALANVGANAVGIWLFGLPGAALATLLSVILWNVWLHRLVSRILGLRPSIFSAFLRTDG